MSWHPLTLAWWKVVWRSPMSARFLEADLYQLYPLAILMDRFWTEETPALSSEIRQRAASFGLDSIARRRLEWEIKAESQIATPPSRKTTAKKPRQGKKGDRRLRILKAG